eukprot:3062728-Prymnesium_polylepis.1
MLRSVCDTRRGARHRERDARGRSSREHPRVRVGVSEERRRSRVVLEAFARVVEFEPRRLERRNHLDAHHARLSAPSRHRRERLVDGCCIDVPRINCGQRDTQGTRRRGRTRGSAGVCKHWLTLLLLKLGEECLERLLPLLVIFEDGEERVHRVGTHGHAAHAEEIGELLVEDPLLVDRHDVGKQRLWCGTRETKAAFATSNKRREREAAARPNAPKSSPRAATCTEAPSFTRRRRRRRITFLFLFTHTHFVQLTLIHDHRTTSRNAIRTAQPTSTSVITVSNRPRGRPRGSRARGSGAGLHQESARPNLAGSGRSSRPGPPPHEPVWQFGPNDCEHTTVRCAGPRRCAAARGPRAACPRRRACP